MTHTRPTPHPTGEDGYLLIGLVVACFLLLLFLGVAAPTVAKQLERDREVESEHRALEYVRAIQLYYKKTNRYPTSVDELLGNATGGGGISLGGTSTNVHYLRQKYTDPLTGGDYRLIHFGEAKTQVKGFFGEPLDGVPAGNLGAAAGMQSNLGNSPAGTFGAAAGGASAAGSPTTGPSGATGTGAGGASGGFGSSSSGGFGSSSSTSATSFQGSKGAIVGVGSDAKGHGLVEWNGSENIQDWEFLYDPRVEILKAKVSIFGGSPAASGSGSLGSGFAPATNSNGAGNGLGTGNSGGFGSSSSFGGSSGGFGSSTGSTPTTPTTPATPATGGSTPPTQ